RQLSGLAFVERIAFFVVIRGHAPDAGLLPAERQELFGAIAVGVDQRHDRVLAHAEADGHSVADGELCADLLGGKIDHLEVDLQVGRIANPSYSETVERDDRSAQAETSYQLRKCLLPVGAAHFSAARDLHDLAEGPFQARLATAKAEF